MPLKLMVADVRDFHVTFRHPAPTTPTMQPLPVAAKRAGWIRDECQELEDARTIHDQADAYLDILYFAAGGLVELGLDGDPLWNIVHSANMAKRDWPDGQPRWREDGKVLKPPTWQDPTPLHVAEVDRQIAASLSQVG